MSTNRDINDDTFCSFPFTHLSTKPNGEVRACCRSTQIGNIRDQDLLDIWNGETLRSLRSDLLTGKKNNICKACWHDESLGINSLRHMANKTVKADISVMDEQYRMPPSIGFLELKLSNLCNFKCRMCYPTDSSLWGADWQYIKQLYSEHNPETYEYLESMDISNRPYISEFKDNDSFWNSWTAIQPTVILLQFAGGEPLIDPLHYRILESIPMSRRGSVQLRYSTNLSKLKHKDVDIFEIWSQFKKVHVDVSIDGDEVLYEYIRTNGIYSDLWDNVTTVSSLSNVHLVIKSCISAFNALYIDRILSDFEHQIKHRRLVKHPIMMQSFVKYPVWLRVDVLPQEIKDLAIGRLIDATSNFENDDAKRIIGNVIKALSQQTDIHTKHWLDFKKFTNALDNIRSGPKFLDIYPDLKSFMS